MTNNTYQALCDSVGARILESKECWYPENDCLSCDEECEKQLVYPPQSAEQLLRLLYLIWDNHLTLGVRIQEFDKTEYSASVLLAYSQPRTTWDKDKTKPDALYALTHKLVAEGVLSKEEVKEALTNV